MGISVGDIVLAARLAWTVYSACQAAPHEFEALSQEVEALYIVLESIKTVVSNAGLDATKVNDLNRVAQGSISVLTELEALMEKYKSLGTGTRTRTWDRLRWGQQEIALLRGRLISNVSLLSAFNSNLANASQTTIIRRLDQTLADIQEGKLRGLSISDQDTEHGGQGHQGIDDAVYESRTPIISGNNPSSDRIVCQIDIISATYGTLDVTNKIRQLFAKHDGHHQVFVPSNVFFGRDPIPNSVKAFILVWRTILPSGTDTEQPYSGVKTQMYLEGEPVILDYNTTLRRFTPPTILPQDILILNASYYTLDVTPIVARIAATQKEGPLVIRATCAQFGMNPAVNTEKQLSITYAYRGPDGSFDHHTQVVGEGGTISIHNRSYDYLDHVTDEGSTPTQLTIHAAYWADLDVAQMLRSRVSYDQTLQIDTSSIHLRDPWFGVSKTLSIMYQYTNGPLQLVVRNDCSGMIFISPTSPLERHFFNPVGRYENKMNILAVVWGTMYDHPEPIDDSQFRWIAEKGRFPCNNEWFKFDGRPNWHKTCHVFYQFGTTGAIRCIAAREGTECRLPKMPLRAHPGIIRDDSHPLESGESVYGEARQQEYRRC